MPRRRAAPASTTIDRKVMFYRTWASTVPGELPPINPVVVLSDIQESIGRGTRWIELDDEERVRVAPHRVDGYTGLSIGKLRSRNLPRFENRITGAASSLTTTTWSKRHTPWSSRTGPSV
jgi:hypothetical protein